MATIIGATWDFGVAAMTTTIDDPSRARGLPAPAGRPDPLDRPGAPAGPSPRVVPIDDGTDAAVAPSRAGGPGGAASSRR